MPELPAREYPSSIPPTNMTSRFNADELIELGREVLRIEAESVLSLVGRLGPAFADAVRLILECRGRVVVSGIGKSGHVARKIAATMASTGTPAFFVHPAEASHGDLGMITPEDVVIALSNSGESSELVAIVPLLKRHGTTLIAITGVGTSTLATLADVHLDAAVEKEACPLGLAPTSSTTAALALGDALAVALLGMPAIVDADHRILGIFTDGDLRRVLAAGADLRHAKIADLMKRNPKTIDADRLAA